MKKLMIGLGITLALGIFIPPVFGTEIADISLTPPISSTDLDMELSWTALDATTMSSVEGYALQWSENQSDIRIDKPYRVLSEGTSTIRSMRAADFDKNATYYFRVYTYIHDGRTTILGNGSKILKWKWLTTGDVESELIDANDPVIVNNSNTDGAVYNFGELRIVKYDTSAQFFWSRPTSLSSKEYDGFKIEISEKSDLTDPVGTIETSNSITKAYITGLKPDTTYYAAGSFYKTEAGEDKKFGRSAIKSFKTEVKFTTEQEARFQRTLVRLKQYGLGETLNLDKDSSTSDSTETTSTTNSSTSNTTTSASTSSSASSYTTVASMETRLEAIKQQIFTLFAERLVLKRNLARQKRLEERN